MPSRTCKFCNNGLASTTVVYGNTLHSCCEPCRIKYMDEADTKEPTKPESAMLYTIKDVQRKLLVLEDEIDYLEVLTNSNTRKERDIALGKAPDSVLTMLLAEMGNRVNERDRLQASLDYHTEHTILDFAIKGAGK